MRFTFFLAFLSTVLIASAQNVYLFVGTYTGTGSKGIYVYRFNTTTGRAEAVSHTDSVVNPSFLAPSPNGKHLYACTETRTVNAGGVTAFSFDRITGQLTRLNKQSSGGDNPCYVAVHKSGKWVVAGNYSGGSLAAFAVNADGSLKPRSQTIRHEGKSVNAERQEMAHVHATVFSPQQNQLFVPDLGMDKVMMYDFNATAAQPLKPSAQAFAAVTPGNGPRHLTFHPNNKWAYLMEEMSGSVVAYEYKGGKLLQRQRIAAHPDTLTSQPGSADIHVSPDGKFLYASNRGRENNIAIFRINGTSGQLTTVGYQSTMGRTPRNFAIDPTGNFLLAANQETDNVVVFKRDAKTGLLTDTGERLNIPKPVCLKMME